MAKVTVFFIFLALLFSCKETPYTDLESNHELYTVNGYVGSGSCIECHKQEYDKWTGSHHDLAMQIANDSTILGDFNNVTAEIDGVSYLFFKKNKEFFVKIKELDDSEIEYKITYAFGVTPLQQYLVDFDKGKKQVLRVTWDVVKKKWYHQYKGDAIEPDDWLHWTRGAQNWNTMCAECHSTNLQKNYDVDADAFNTSYSEINVACESCHGQAKSHINWAKKNPLDKNTHISRGLNQDEQLNQCAGCHARRSKLTANSEPGKNFEDQFILQTLSTEYYHGDGQIDEEDYVYGSFRQSKMYDEGVKCSDCHDPHTLKLKFDDNNLCIQCHAPTVYDTETHHFHAENTEASLCINCHMTGKNYMGNDFRRDHSFRIPRPDQSVAYGTPNACIGCHEDKNDPHCVKSRTGYVINMGGSPIIWKSNLQPIISSSTMESEYIAMSTACKELIPRAAKEIAKACGVSNEERASMHTTIWEDNVGALTLANLELPQMTPRSKAIGVRYHWFRQYVSRDNGEDGGIVIKKVDTKDQIADIFTKGLSRQLFERLRKMLSGW